MVKENFFDDLVYYDKDQIGDDIFSYVNGIHLCSRRETLCVLNQ